MPETAVTLRPVTKETFSDVVRLRVAEDQRSFVADNAVSIAQTAIHPWSIARVVCEGDVPVGFALYGRDPADGAWWIVRLMIAAQHQRRGLGRAAMRLLLADIDERRCGEDVLVSLVPGNDGARRLYESLGFRDTGRIQDREHVLRREVSASMGAPSPAATAPARVELIAARPEHAAAWGEWRAESASLRYNPLRSLSVPEIEERLGRVGQDLSNHDCTEYRWMVTERGVVVGTVAVMSPSWSMGYAEIGYQVGARHQGRGLATAAVRALVEKLFSETDLHHLLAHVAVGNEPSRRLLQRLGFHQEGTLREHYLVEGRRTDEAVYGLLRQEWGALGAVR